MSIIPQSATVLMDESCPQMPTSYSGADTAEFAGSWPARSLIAPVAMPTGEIDLVHVIEDDRTELQLASHDPAPTRIGDTTWVSSPV